MHGCIKKVGVIGEDVIIKTVFSTYIFRNCTWNNAWIDVLKAYEKQFNITRLRWMLPEGETGQESIDNGLLFAAGSHKWAR